MTLFDEIWRMSATPMLNEHFGESNQAVYLDGTGTERGSYDVLLGPEQAIEEEKKNRRQTRFQRTATFSWEPDSPLWESNVGPTGRIIVVDGASQVEYSIGGVLSRSASSLVLILKRSATQRQWSPG